MGRSISTILFSAISVIPTKDNVHYDTVEGARVCFWIRESDPASAMARITFEAKKYDWEITEIDTAPTEVSEESFVGRELGLSHYKKAKDKGISIEYTGWPRKGQTPGDLLKLETSYKVDINKYISNQKKINNSGRCLHFKSNERCNEIIKAHSIQKNGILSKISKNGKVYCVSGNFGSLRDNDGAPSFEKDGINRVSTFKGFCMTHDNDLFEPIDNSYLVPTHHQAILYAYRSMCREIFVKENSLTTLVHQAQDLGNHTALQELFNGTIRGIRMGLDSLNFHKKKYDTALENKNYMDTQYVVFCSKDTPFMAFSGVLYPEYDFKGNQLQNLADSGSNFELITFCSAPMSHGWGLIFSWQRNSSNSCVKLLNSLAEVVHDGIDIGDLLFRFVISNCENIAFSPDWWESLSESDISQISGRVSSMANIFSKVKRNYLAEGMSGISKWRFEKVYPRID